MRVCIKETSAYLLRWNGHPLKCSGFPVDLPIPFSPVHSARKFSAVLGVMSAKSSRTIRPAADKQICQYMNTQKNIVRKWRWLLAIEWHNYAKLVRSSRKSWFDLVSKQLQIKTLTGADVINIWGKPCLLLHTLCGCWWSEVESNSMLVNFIFSLFFFLKAIRT